MAADAIRLSERLSALLSMLPPCGTLADIGCDHGMLGAAALGRGMCTRLVATDVSAPSLEKARALLAPAGPRVSFRLGDGLSVLEPGEAEGAVVAGMGGMEIIRILEKDMETACTASFLALGPHRDAPALRRFLTENGWYIACEQAARERSRIYPLLLARPGSAAASQCDPFFWETGWWPERQPDEGFLESLAALAAHARMKADYADRHATKEEALARRALAERIEQTARRLSGGR